MTPATIGWTLTVIIGSAMVVICLTIGLGALLHAVISKMEPPA